MLVWSNEAKGVIEVSAAKRLMRRVQRPGRVFLTMRVQERRGVIVPCANIDELAYLIGGGVRLELIRRLACGPRSVTQLTQDSGLVMSQVSQNLQSLRERGLVSYESRDRSRLYQLSEQIAIELNQGLLVFSMRSMNGESITVHTSPLHPAIAAE